MCSPALMLCPSFSQSVIIIATSCVGTVIVPTCGFARLTSPGYPSPYSNNEDCFWFLQSPVTTRMRIVFIAFTTEGQYDFLQIGDGTDINDSAPQYSGDVRPSTPMFTQSNRAWIRFKTDDTKNDIGFSLEVQDECYGEQKFIMKNILQRYRLAYVR